MYCRSILVIEDDKDIREAVEQVLTMEGYEVFCAGNGKEALDALPGLAKSTLILLDMMMPVMNGWQFLDAKAADPRFAEMPVVIVSAVPEGRALVQDSGVVQAEGLLRKPLDVESLLKIVERYCVPAKIAQTEESAMASATGMLH